MFTNKRFKTIRYNRMITFGYLNGNDGRCFICIFDKSDNFGDFLNRANGFKIGSIIAFYKADVPSGSISKNYDLPVLSNFTSSCLVDKDPGNNIRFVFPKSGETKFFRYSGFEVAVKFAKIVKTSCNGEMCDKQRKNCFCPASRMITLLVI